MRNRFHQVITFIHSKFEFGIIFALSVIPILIIGLHFLDVNVKAPVREDGVGYYAYLPAVFIYDDINFDFMIDEDVPYTKGINSFERVFNPREAEVMGFNKLENGNILDKYPIGVAVMLAPFFVIGHIFSLIFGTNLSGWSFFYQYFCFYGGVVYFLLGLLLLKRLLSRYFTPGTVLLSLFAITFGTSLFNYATYENIFSHVYAFFLGCVLLILVPKWLKRMTPFRSAFLGAVLGLLFIVRNTNIIYFLMVPLFGVTNFMDLRERLHRFWKNRRQILIVASVCILFALPQFLYWKTVSSDWVVYSYGEEGFRFFNPQILNVLFSPQKGLFFWAPILLPAVLGLFLLKGRLRKYILPGAIILILQVYLVSSWWSWEFGWSFGHRAFVDSMGVFALGFAGFYSTIRQDRYRIIATIVTVLLVGLSVFQMGQYWAKILPPAQTTWEDYKKVFLNFDPNLRYFWRDKFTDDLE